MLTEENNNEITKRTNVRPSLYSYYFSVFRKERNKQIVLLMNLNLFIEVEVNCLFMVTFEKNLAEIFYDTDISMVLFF